MKAHCLCEPSRIILEEREHIFNEFTTTSSLNFYTLLEHPLIEKTSRTLWDSVSKYVLLHFQFFFRKFVNMNKS